MSGLSLQRSLTIVAVALLGGAMLWSYSALSRSKASLVESLEAFGTASRQPGSVRDVSREADVPRARLKAARALLAEEIDRRWLAELSPEAAEVAVSDGEAKLELARDLALDTLTSRPSSWQALMILGGSRYLLASRRGVPARWSDSAKRASWEKPLHEAIERSPLQAEPRRVLAAIYLNEWSVASDAERRALLPHLSKAFENLETLEQLLPIWLRRAASFEQALSVIPEDPRAWHQLEHYYRQRQDWPRMVRVLEQLEQARPVRLQARLERARRMIAGRDTARARNVLLAAIDETPIRLEYSHWLNQAIGLLPAGPVSARRARGFGSWLDWSVDRCLIAECPFETDVVRRLAGLARASEPPKQAALAVLEGDSARGRALGGQLFLSRPNPSITDAWAPYLLLEARASAQAGQPDEAAKALQAAANGTRHRPLALHLARKLGLSDSVARFQPTTNSEWFGTSSRHVREHASEAPIERLAIRFDQVGEAGALAEVRVNGALDGFHSLERGSVLRLTFREPVDFARVELIRRAGDPFSPAN